MNSKSENSAKLHETANRQNQVVDAQFFPSKISTRRSAYKIDPTKISTKIRKRRSTYQFPWCVGSKLFVQVVVHNTEYYTYWDDNHLKWQTMNCTKGLHLNDGPIPEWYGHPDYIMKQPFRVGITSRAHFPFTPYVPSITYDLWVVPHFCGYLLIYLFALMWSFARSDVTEAINIDSLCCPINIAVPRTKHIPSCLKRHLHFFACWRGVTKANNVDRLRSLINTGSFCNAASLSCWGVNPGWEVIYTPPRVAVFSKIQISIDTASSHNTGELNMNPISPICQYRLPPSSDQYRSLLNCRPHSTSTQV